MNPSLLELQQAVRRSLLTGDDRAIARQLAGTAPAAHERLALYRNTFRVTLTRALRLSFPAVRKLVGDDFFDAVAHDFIAHEPPRSSHLDRFGGGLAAFLDGFAPAASLPYLGDVARLEWAVNQALHAPDAAAPDFAALSALAATDAERLRFTPHPSVRLLHTCHPARAIWRGVLEDDDAALASIDLTARPCWLLVHRGPGGVDVLPLDASAWNFTAALCDGQPLGAALQTHGDAPAAATLADLIARGCLTGRAPAPHASPSQP